MMKKESRLEGAIGWICLICGIEGYSFLIMAAIIGLIMLFSGSGYYWENGTEPILLIIGLVSSAIALLGLFFIERRTVTKKFHKALQ